MSALPQARPKNTLRKPVSSDSASSRLDQFGRDPESLSEKLRNQTDYEKDSGYAPLYHAALADLPRLAGGSAVAYALVLVVNMLSYGRGKDARGRRYEWTLPISTEDLAQLCRANVRDIQRQLSEMAERGMIASKTIRQGGVKYSISLLYPKWRELEDYAVWKRRQLVVMDSVEDTEAEDDDAPLAITKDAVQLTKAPKTVRPGRASKAVKVNVGVRELSLQNDSSAVDVGFSAVVQSGRLVVSVSSSQVVGGEAKSEDKANAARHTRRQSPPNGGSPDQTDVGARAGELIEIFDPLLQKSGARLLAIDRKALAKASAELGDVPHDVLLHFLHAGRTARASRPISSPLAVASIVRECRQHWEKNRSEVEAHERESERERLERLERHALLILDNPDATEEDREWARGILKRT